MDKRIVRYFLLAAVAIASASCATMFTSSATYNDGIYGTHSRTTATQPSAHQTDSHKAAEAIDLELYSTPYGQKLLALAAVESTEEEVSEYVRPESYYIFIDSYATRYPYNPFFHRHWGRHHHWGRPHHNFHWNWGWNWGWNSWDYRYNWGWNYGYGWNSWGWNYGFGWSYPMIHMPYRPVSRPPHIVNRPSYSKSIVSHTTKSSATTSTGTRQKSGATVGTSTSSSYNRGGGTSSTKSSSSSSTKSSSSNSSRATSATNSATSGRSTNAIGR